MLPNTVFAMCDLLLCAQMLLCHLCQVCGFSSSFPFRCSWLQSHEIRKKIWFVKVEWFESRSILMANYTLQMTKSALATWSLFKAINLSAIKEFLIWNIQRWFRSMYQPFSFLFSQEYTMPQHNVQEHHSLMWRCSV